MKQNLPYEELNIEKPKFKAPAPIFINIFANKQVFSLLFIHNPSSVKVYGFWQIGFSNRQ